VAGGGRSYSSSGSRSLSGARFKNLVIVSGAMVESCSDGVF